MKNKSDAAAVEEALRLLDSGKSQREAASAAGITRGKLQRALAKRDKNKGRAIEPSVAAAVGPDEILTPEEEQIIWAQQRLRERMPDAWIKRVLAQVFHVSYSTAQDRVRKAIDANGSEGEFRHPESEEYIDAMIQHTLDKGFASLLEDDRKGMASLYALGFKMIDWQKRQQGFARQALAEAEQDASKLVLEARIKQATEWANSPQDD
jgi:hypothetical protein